MRFLANRDENLHFGLLTDFRDATEETLRRTNRCCGWPRKRIEELNEQYRRA